jgi:hypothetical protein
MTKGKTQLIENLKKETLIEKKVNCLNLGGNYLAL